MLKTPQYINQMLKVKIDRPLKSKHPKYGFEYELNYGFIPETISADGEEIDAYVMNVSQPLSEFYGRCAAVIHRTNDDDDKLVVVPENTTISNLEIEKQTAFQEKWFKHIIIRNPRVTKTHFGVYGAIINDNKILLIKKARGPYTGLYDLPGGSQEEGETFLQTLYREIKEETNCEVIEANNERRCSVIFADFTKESGEQGVLQHESILYDVKVSGNPSRDGDGLDSNGAVWVDIQILSTSNATPNVLLAVKGLSHNVKVRTAVVKDAHRMVEINVQTWKTAYAGLLPDEFLQKRKVTEERIQKLAEQIAQGQYIILAAEVDNSVVGYLCGGMARDKNYPYAYELSAFYVLKEYQHCGVGQMLFDEFKARINSQSFYAYMLKGNNLALRFYQKNGGVEMPQYQRPLPTEEFVGEEILLAFEN